MSSTRREISSTENVKLVIDALADYAKTTGKDLSTNPFADKFQQSNSPEDILQLLEEREKAFKDYREGNRRLINWLKPAVKVLHAFSGVLGAAARHGLIPFPPASALFVGIDTLLAAALEVSSSYDALSDLFDHLGSFVKRLDIYTKIDLTPIMIDIIVKIMVELLSVLALATKQITQKRFKKFVKKLLGENEIEVILQRLDRLTLDEARIGVAETLGVVHGLVGNVKKIMEDREASMDNIRQDLGALHRELIEINKTRRDQLQRDAKDWLSPPDPSTNHIFVSDARHSGTASWFFKSEKSKEWNARGSLLWIRGKPGAGKSTLLSAIIEDIESKHAIGLAKMTYYYFDFRDDKKQDRYGLLSSLILQLSSESDSCYNILSKLYSSNNRARRPTFIVLKKCIKDMLSLPGQGPIYIVIDALDECPTSCRVPSARREVMELIEELVSLKLSDMYFCVASRPEIDIQMALEPMEPLQVSLDDEIGQKDDITAYIEYTVRSNSTPEWTEKDQELVIYTLSQKANGMFRYVACQMDNVLRCFSNDIQRTLDDLPKDLDETYERTLQDIDKQKRKYAKRLFQCLSVSIRPLRLEELADIFAVQFDAIVPTLFAKDSRPRNIEWAVLSSCSSLITTIGQGGSRVVQFSHFSVKEYLASERLAQAEEHLSFYRIIPEPAHTLLARASLSVLLQLEDRFDRDTIGHFPLAPYAARHWVDHAKFGGVLPNIQEVMERLFDPTKTHFAAWVWLYDIDRYWTEPMSTTHPTPPEAAPLYYASLCGFCGLVEHLITAHSSDVNSRGGSHTTPLHAASVKGHLDVASLLLKSGADPNSHDIADRVPLHRVSQGGRLVKVESSLAIAQLLINYGANVNDANNYQRWTPLHAAAVSGYRDVAELLIESGASIDFRNRFQETSLHLASANRRLDVLQFLIDRGLDINCRDGKDLIPLHTASQSGHVEAARLLLDCGSDVNAQTANRRTPLHLASRYGYLNLGRLLIEHGADVNAQNANRWTPIHFASNNGHLDIIKLLVEQGAHVDSQNNKEETPLFCAVDWGFLDIARFLIESGAAVSARDNKGRTAFHVASDGGHLPIVKFLLECDVDVNNRNGDGETALDSASAAGKVDIVRFLIEHGADINVQDNGGWTPLHIASLNGHLDVVRLLIDTGTPVDIRDRFQQTPLALASVEGKVEVGCFLIERGADINAQGNYSWVPLHFASEYGRLDMAQLLLDHGVDPNIQQDHLWSPLHLASANGYLDLAELLVQRGASIDVFDNMQETPLYQAIKNGKVATARLLIDHGANLHTVNSNGWTLLHAASYSGHLGVVKLLLQQGVDVDVLNKANRTAAELASTNGKAEVAKFIADYKADVNTRNRLRLNTLDTVQDQDGGTDKEKTSLHAAAEEGNIEVVRSLLEQGVDVNGRNADNQIPLYGAAAEGNLDVVRLLIERGSEVDSRDRRGWTPLHVASECGHPKVAQALIDHGAIVNARTHLQSSPIHLSMFNKNLELVRLLLERGADVHAVNCEGETAYELLLQGGNREMANLLREHGAGGTARESPW